MSTPASLRLSAPFSACLSLAAAMTIVGSSVAVGKLMVQELPLHFASALRFALASAVLAPLVLAREGRLPRLPPRDFLLVALQALCGSYLFTVLLLSGVEASSAAMAGIITSTTPACVGLLGWLLLGERPGGRALCGLLLSAAGLFVAASGSGAWADQATLRGCLLVLGAVACESAFLLLRRAVKSELSPLSASLLVSCFGLAYFLPQGLMEASSAALFAAGPGAWAAVAYYGLVVTVGAYLFWFAGVVRVSAAVAGIFTAVLPVSALVFSAVLAGERLGLGHLAGCALVLGGIACLALPAGARRPASADVADPLGGSAGRFSAEAPAQARPRA